MFGGRMDTSVPLLQIGNDNDMNAISRRAAPTLRILCLLDFAFVPLFSCHTMLAYAVNDRNKFFSALVSFTLFLSFPFFSFRGTVGEYTAM
jgi:hypothetical protein